MPRPTVLDNAENIALPSRESHRQIPCRVFRPKANDSKGIFYHVGFVYLIASAQVASVSN
jgi:hypothetical protein